MFFTRTLQLIGLCFRFAIELYLLHKTERGLKGHRANRRREKLYRSQAIRYRKIATNLGGLPIKVGQFLSTRIDVLPKPYIEELTKLQDTVVPVPFTQIQAVLIEELGPLDKHFSHFNPEPIGAASLAQVYAARLIDGTEVAVKVLRPQIEEQIKADLRALKLLVGYLAKYSFLAERIDLWAVYAEFLETLNQELDLTTEAAHLTKFRQNFSGNPQVYIPWIYPDLTRRKVLVMEKIDGVKITNLTQLQKLGVNPNQIAEVLLNSYIKQIVDYGFFHADPHPGNLLVDKEKRLVYIDFGMMGRIKPEQKPIFLKGLSGLVRNDTKVIVTALIDLGFILPHADLAAIERGVALLMDHFSSTQIRGLSTQEALWLMEEMSTFIWEQPIQVPTNFTFLGRAIGIILGLLETLAPDLNILDLIRAAAGADSAKNEEKNWQFIISEATNWLKDAFFLPTSVKNMATAITAGKIQAQVDLTQINTELTYISRQLARLTRLLFLLIILMFYFWLKTSLG